MIKAEAKVIDKLGGAGLKNLATSLEQLLGIKVYVGVPEDKAARKAGSINNAQLAYIHTNGSPLRGIPARPVIEPAIEAEDNKAAITEQFELAGIALLEITTNRNKTEEVRKYLIEAGQLGRDAAKNWFTDPRNGWPPDTRATVMRKLSKLKGREKLLALGAMQTKTVSRTITGYYPQGPLSETFNRREASGSYKDDTGTDVSVDTPLIDSGAYRASISYIVKEFEKIVAEG